MAAVIDLLEDIVDIIIAVVEIVIEIVEAIIEFIMSLLGFEDQVIEYFDVQNIPLFENPERGSPDAAVVTSAVLREVDIASELIYAGTFRSLKVNLRSFIAFIDDGNYFEDFPNVESHIAQIGYDDLIDTLTTLEGSACSLDQTALKALDNQSWIASWMQDNQVYDVGTNEVGAGRYETVTTTPITPAATGYSLDAGSPAFEISITDEVATEDSVLADQRWSIQFNGTVYNSGPDDYSIEAIDASGVEIFLPYTAPSKPLQLHYVSYYYVNSAPSDQFIFIYKVGSGTYPVLDAGVEQPIDIDNSNLQAMPAIPLRISNVTYTSFTTAKRDAINDLCDLVDLDAENIIDAIMNDPGVVPGDIDNVYLNFGVPLWDTTQAGLTYLFAMFENLFPAQGITQGDYNDAASGDTKPTNNLIITTADYKSVFQFNYITFEHTTLATIDGDSGSDENGIYYSDMSKFKDGIIVYDYYISSGKGTYNVGFKSDTLAEVTLFLAGTGVVNPGTVSTEGAAWMQPTVKMRYTDTLQESDGSTSTLRYITPDMVYTNASGTLRLVEQASEETTSGQSITYYLADEDGLDAYTVAAPIAVLKVVDAASGNFKMVKFNLGDKVDLMVPLLYEFIQNGSNHDISKLFLTASHISIYIANYEVIELSIWAQLLIIAAIVIAIVIIVVSWGTQTGPVMIALEAIVAGVATTVIIQAAVVAILQGLIIAYAIELIITEVAKHSPELAAILAVAAAVVMVAYGNTEGLGLLDYGKIVGLAMKNLSIVVNVYVEGLDEELNLAYEALVKDTELEDLLEIKKDLFQKPDGTALDLLNGSLRLQPQFPLRAEEFLALSEGYIEANFIQYEQTAGYVLATSGTVV